MSIRDELVAGGWGPVAGSRGTAELKAGLRRGRTKRRVVRGLLGAGLVPFEGGADVEAEGGGVVFE